MKTQIKKSLALWLTYILSITMLFSQTQTGKTVLEELEGKTWEMQGMTDKTAWDKYEAGRITHYFNGDALAISEYYLSDTIVEIFNSENLGKIANGKYIVSRMIPIDNKLKSVPVSVYEIKQLNKNWLILRYVKHQHSIKFKLKE
jgi:hypothetical protein